VLGAGAALAGIAGATAPREQLAALEERLADDLRPGVPGSRRVRSRAGEKSPPPSSNGRRTTEGTRDTFPPYQPPVGPGLWVPTPPGFLALQPFWGGNRCLALRNGAAIGAGTHPPYAEDRASAFDAEALEVYEAVTSLTPDQEAIARFWSDDPAMTPTPPGHSLSVTTQVLRATGSSLAAAAEAYALVGMAVCDASIACWYRKYIDNLLRPVTYIKRLIDPDWLPPLVTPPFPEYRRNIRSSRAQPSRCLPTSSASDTRSSTALTTRGGCRNGASVRSSGGGRLPSLRRHSLPLRNRQRPRARKTDRSRRECAPPPYLTDERTELALRPSRLRKRRASATCKSLRTKMP
jgi:hypothetical protein